jgi:hypothetical protein
MSRQLDLKETMQKKEGHMLFVDAIAEDMYLDFFL